MAIELTINEFLERLGQTFEKLYGMSQLSTPGYKRGGMAQSAFQQFMAEYQSTVAAVRSDTPPLCSPEEAYHRVQIEYTNNPLHFQKVVISEESGAISLEQMTRDEALRLLTKGTLRQDD